jgi:hypothetical protein
MKLLHTEIDVVPGRKPQREPVAEGFVGSGLAMLRIVNNTDQENAYTIRLKCEEPYWQDNWYQLSALPPQAGPENAPPSGKPDQPGPKNQSLTVYVSRGGTRNVLISFEAPDKSESRAGVYPFKVVVETRISGAGPGKERFTELPGVAIVRPFYKWGIAVVPPDRRVGFFKRSTSYELVVENHGNDWLYCDLKLPRPQNVLIDTPTVRLAIPPPEPGQDSIRTLPIRGISRMRALRGSPTTAPLPFSVHRVHAPTMPPLPEDPVYGTPTANLGAAVVAEDTTEVGSPEEQPSLTYCPLIPATLTDFLRAIATNIRGLVFAVIGLIIAFNLAVFMYEQVVVKLRKVEPMRRQVKAGEWLNIRGSYLIGSKILIFDKKTGGELAQIVPRPADVKLGEEEKVKIQIPEDLNNKVVTLGARRMGWLPFLPGLQTVTDKTPVTIGNPPEDLSEMGVSTYSPTVKPGGQLKLRGKFGKKQGLVLINGDQVPCTWSETQIMATVPSSIQQQVTVQIEVEGKPLLQTPIIIPVEFHDEELSGEDLGGGATPTEVSGTAGGSTPASSSGGSTPAPAALPPPAGYENLLSDSRSDLGQAIIAAERADGHETNAEIQAVRAYAYAARRMLANADQVLNKAERLTADKRNRGYALYLAARGKMEEVRGDAPDSSYDEAMRTMAGVSNPLALPYLAFAKYKLAKGNPKIAKWLLDKTNGLQLPPADRQAVQALRGQVQ